jgi:hypothetical protein
VRSHKEIKKLRQFLFKNQEHRCVMCLWRASPCCHPNVGHRAELLWLATWMQVYRQGAELSVSGGAVPCYSWAQCRH